MASKQLVDADLPYPRRPDTQTGAAYSVVASD
jgi:hypothetical protein